jgi:hypothetical protein
VWPTCTDVGGAERRLDAVLGEVGGQPLDAVDVAFPPSSISAFAPAHSGTGGDSIPKEDTMDEAENRTGTPAGGQATRVTPGVPPSVGPNTETVRRELHETRRGAESAGDDQPDGAKEQAQQKAEHVKQRAQEQVKQVKEGAPDQLGRAASTIQEQARQNPLPFAVGGALLAGFVLGRASRRS